MRHWQVAGFERNGGPPVGGCPLPEAKEKAIWRILTGPKPQKWRKICCGLFLSFFLHNLRGHFLGNGVFLGFRDAFCCVTSVGKDWVETCSLAGRAVLSHRAGGGGGVHGCLKTGCQGRRWGWSITCWKFGRCRPYIILLASLVFSA